MVSVQRGVAVYIIKPLTCLTMQLMLIAPICMTRYVALPTPGLRLAKIPAYLLITITVSVPNECMILIRQLSWC